MESIELLVPKNYRDLTIFDTSKSLKKYY